jgi:hypothetical protein
MLGCCQQPTSSLGDQLIPTYLCSFPVRSCRMNLNETGLSSDSLRTLAHCNRDTVCRKAFWQLLQLWCFGMMISCEYALSKVAAFPEDVQGILEK